MLGNNNKIFNKFKITVIIVVILFFNFLNISACCAIDSDTNYICTPKGSDVTILIRKHDLSDYTKKQYDSFIKLIFPDAIIIAPATNKYNDNSYSWCNKFEHFDTYNLIDPLDFINDGSFTKSSLNNGAIIAYGNEYIHSGIVSDIDSSTFYVTSKWGEMGLIYHDYKNTPFLCNDYSFYTQSN